jgi:proline iminopeptidase
MPDPATTRVALAALQAPVLLLSGEVDVALPPSCAAAYAALFPHADLALQPAASDFPWLDEPAWFVRTVAAFPR